MAHNNNSTQSTSALTTAASVDSALPLLSEEEISKKLASLEFKFEELKCSWDNGPVPPQSKYELLMSLFERSDMEVSLPLKALMALDVSRSVDTDTYDNSVELHPVFKKLICLQIDIAIQMLNALDN